VKLWSTGMPKETEIVQKVESTKSYCYKQVRELLVEELCKELLTSAKEENGKMKVFKIQEIFIF
jgi:predicted transcriptional regulator